ncbi:hypothetical protein PtA15_12A92 [Puccinia triticina]|uniref:Uncharacterized protein n=1 Tax=Puccinia triticina TaxID=208348 RepID=A0ABY7D1G8_9BASI|nr:uncharacterized protein PtA15_12A92 [Puccinia triticina]WAQ90107.1 hypothetical protein PtA15_12A92 [Puccinia triticina]
MQTLDSIDNALAANLKEGKAGSILVPKYKRQKQRHGVMLFEPLLYEYAANFEDQINQGKLEADRFRTTEIICHSDLPFGMIKRPAPATDKVLRVLVGQFVELQDIRMLRRIYRSLIVSLHKLHDEVLQDLRIPRSARIELHRDLFRWLEKQLYRPDVGVPVFGFVSANSFYGITIGATQSELIKLFAEDPWSEPPNETLKFLIDTYRQEGE